LNEVRICFIFVPSSFAVVLEMISSPEDNLRMKVRTFLGLLSIRP
jgi:hypothetical protein